MRYVPAMKRNLISLAMLDSMGYKFHSENGNMVVSTGEKKRDLYFLDESVVNSQINLTKNADNTYLWHGRLAHVSTRGLQEQAKQDLVGGDKITNIELCEHCIARRKEIEICNWYTHYVQSNL